jgi:uncharacterized membrane protein YhaH (DUF805 family)
VPRYWFKRRRYGCGWIPATREGWLIVLAFVGVLVVTAVIIDAVGAGDTASAVVFLAVVVVAVAGLVGVTLAKGPTPRWRWGRAPGDDPDEDF